MRQPVGQRHPFGRFAACSCQTSRGLLVLIVLALAGASPMAAQAGGHFEKVKVFLERNVMDKDAEAKFEAIGGEGGLKSLKVVAPDGRTVIDFQAAASSLGMRHLSFESPEPMNDGRVQADFPAGTYTFLGTGVDGGSLEAKTTLSHDFPAPAAFLHPSPDAKAVATKGLRVRWKAVHGLDALVVVVEDESSGREVRANLAGDVTSFAVPDGFLRPAAEYKLAIGTVAKDGNATFIETSFTTAAK